MASNQQPQFDMSALSAELFINCNEDVVSLLAAHTWDMEDMPVSQLSPSALISGQPAAQPNSASTPRGLWGEVHSSVENGFGGDDLLQYAFPSLDQGVDLNNNDINTAEEPRIPDSPPQHRAQTTGQGQGPIAPAGASVQPSKKRDRRTSENGNINKRAKTEGRKSHKNQRRIDITALRNRILYGMEVSPYCVVMEMEKSTRI